MPACARPSPAPRRTPLPELPEVEAAKRYLESEGLIGRRFTGADLRWPRAIRTGDVEDFVLGITGAAVRRLDRRGKFILIQLAPSQNLFSPREKIEMRGPLTTTTGHRDPPSPPRRGDPSGRPGVVSGPPSPNLFSPREKIEMRGPLAPTTGHRRPPPSPPVPSPPHPPAYLGIHLGMTGSIPIVDAAEPRHRFAHNILPLDDGREIRFIDPRKLGGLWLAADVDQIAGRLGIEPLGRDFRADALAARLTGRKAPIKPLLLDQSLIAGVGNIYADEALVRAGVSPLRPANTLTAAEIAALHAGLIEALQLAIERLTSLGAAGKPPTAREETRDYFLIPRQPGAPCRRCGAPVHRTVIRARSAYHCPTCQR